MVISAAEPGDASHEQPLQTPWTFWFDRITPDVPYINALQRLGTVHTVQGFWRYYCNLTRPGQLMPGDNYHFFRGGMQPAQETLPSGGCWFYRIQIAKGDHCDVEVNRLWETLLLTIVGESIGEPCVVGASISMRSNEIVLATWCRKHEDYDGAVKRIGQQLQSVFGPGSEAKLKWLSTKVKAPPVAISTAKTEM